MSNSQKQTRDLIDNTLKPLALQLIDKLSLVDAWTYSKGKRRNRTNWFQKWEWGYGNLQSDITSVNGKNAYTFRNHPLNVIQFSDLRIINATDVTYGELEQIDVGVAPDQPQGDKLTNNSAEPVDINWSKEIEKTKEKEESFSTLVENEFSITYGAKVGGSIKLFEVEANVETQLRNRIELTSNRAWRASDTVKQSKAYATKILPYHTFQITATETVKNLRQDVVSNGELECQIYIDCRDFTAYNFESLDELRDNFSGLLPGGNHEGRRWAEYFKSHPIDSDFITNPVVKLNLPIEAKRTRLSNIKIDQKPLPGYEHLAKKEK